jgi:hypothetical protein
MSQTDRTANNIETLFHPVSHYDSPVDVLNDASLSTGEKRVILSSWASDMYVVESHPTLREIPGMQHRLRLDDILAALRQLDDDTDPPPSGGLAMQLPQFGKPDCAASHDPRRITGRQASEETVPICNLADKTIAAARSIAVEPRGKRAQISQAPEHTTDRH